MLCFQEYDSGSCSSVLGLSASSSECCENDGENAYRTSLGECMQCPINMSESNHYHKLLSFDNSCKVAVILVKLLLY